jgi:hypothetical protein
MKKEEAKREGDKLFVYVACGYRWEQTPDPIKEDVKEFADEDEAIAYAEKLDLSIGFQSTVDKYTFRAEDFEEGEELELRQAIDNEDIFYGEVNYGKEITDAIIIEWSYEKYPGYARNLLDIGVGGGHPFWLLEHEADLITGNEESTFRSNYSVLLTKEEVEVCETPEELEVKIFEELCEGHWKWNYFKNNPQSAHIAEKINEIANELIHLK